MPRVTSTPLLATAQRDVPRVAQCDVQQVDHLVLAGWAGRDQASVEAHIRELEVLGAPRPTRTPVFYRVSASLLTLGSAIQVVGGDTSGEAEFVLVPRNDGLWVGLGSDHTDRALERTSVALSKQVCAKVVAPTLWRFDDLASHWDDLELRAWRWHNGARVLYQEGALSHLLPPTTLLGMYSDFAQRLESGGMLFSGTLPAIGGIKPADVFEMELVDPVLGRRLQHQYTISELPVNA